MMCSANSLGCSASSASRRSSSAAVAPRRRVPAMGRDVTTPSRRRTMGSGDDPTTVHPAAHEVEVGTRIDQTQDAVEVEGIGIEIEIETLGQHHLEDVTRRDVLLGHRHGIGVHGGPSSCAASAPRRPGRGAPCGRVEGSEQIGRQLVQSFAGAS